MSKRKLDEIYVDLDVLLDTRLGTLARLSKDAAEQTLLNDYHKRTQDIFEGVDMAEYKALYAKRDQVTLEHSLVTGAVPLLRQLVTSIVEQSISNPLHGGVEIVVNLHPYVLTSEEADEIRLVIATWVQGLAKVSTTVLHPEDLTPTHCKARFAMMLLYNVGSWLELHHREFATVQIPEITVFSPALYEVQPTETELVENTKEATHPFQAFEWIASPLITLNLIDVKYFSVITKL